MNTDFKNLAQVLKNAKTAAIIGHVRPDGDCIGSALALRMYLIRCGYTRADVFIDGDIPDNFMYLPQSTEINKAVPAAKYDIVIAVDSSDEARFGKYKELLCRAKKSICIDHHLNTAIAADLVITNSEHGSVGEILYEFFTANNIEITIDMATAIYTSVSSDTGCFLFSNTTVLAHQIAADLINKGIDFVKINYYNFQAYDIEMLPGLIYMLRRLKFSCGGKIAIAAIPHKQVAKYNLIENRHRLLKYLNDAKGVVVSIFITEDKKNEQHISMRSHGEINVGEIALSFGGGGHKRAAGLTVNGKMKDVMKQILAKTESLVNH